jgi:hypothetical protein
MESVDGRHPVTLKGTAPTWSCGSSGLGSNLTDDRNGGELPLGFARWADLLCARPVPASEVVWPLTPARRRCAATARRRAGVPVGAVVAGQHTAKRLGAGEPGGPAPNR